MRSSITCAPRPRGETTIEAQAAVPAEGLHKIEGAVEAARILSEAVATDQLGLEHDQRRARAPSRRC